MLHATPPILHNVLKMHAHKFCKITLFAHYQAPHCLAGWHCVYLRIHITVYSCIIHYTIQYSIYTGADLLIYLFHIHYREDPDSNYTLLDPKMSSNWTFKNHKTLGLGYCVQVFKFNFSIKVQLCSGSELMKWSFRIRMEFM